MWNYFDQIVIKSYSLILLAIIPIISIPVLAQESVNSDSIIPPWVKGVANFWVEDKIDDGEFAEALEFLIDSDIIQLGNNIIQSDSIVIVPEQEIDWEEKYNVLLKQNNSNEQHYLEKNKKIIDNITEENEELQKEVIENHRLAQEEESKLKEKIKELKEEIRKTKFN